MTEEAKTSRTITLSSKDMPSTPNIDTPAYFVDGIQGTSLVNGTVRLSFYEDRVDIIDGDIKHRHVLTLIMAEQNMRQIHEFLGKLIKEKPEG